MQIDPYPKEIISGESTIEETAVISPSTILSDHRQAVFLDRYSLKDKDGNPTEHTVEEMWHRVAHAAAQAEASDQALWEDRFYDSLKGFKFIPGGRILAGLGSGHKVTNFNCLVVPPCEDSRAGIVQRVQQMIEIMSRGGGVGINLSSIRPKGSYVRTVNGTASGPVSWAELFSAGTGIVCQSGTRRGALILLLDISHPDIEEFIRCKDQIGALSQANISVAISDQFMDAVKHDLEWNLVWRDSVKKTLRARDLWRQVAEHAWRTGDPGIVWTERYQKLSNTAYFDTIQTTNPCGEEGLPDWGVCNLGSINLSALVTPDGRVSRDKLEQTIRYAVRFLDDVVDLDPGIEPLPQIRETELGSRRIGLGTVGLADALIKCQIRYGSQESLRWIDKLYSFIRDEAYRASVEIAEEKGPFPKFQAEYLGRPFIQALPQDIRSAMSSVGIRNATILTQAPTGTISILANTSSGIEPNFAFVTKRRDRTGEHLMRHSLYEQWEKGHPGEARPNYFVEAHELTPDEHVLVQSRIQVYTDASVSKTINMPNNATVDDVMSAYQLAYESGCKGLTVFRDGCREGVLERLSIDEKLKLSDSAMAADRIKRAEKLHGISGDTPIFTQVKRPYGPLPSVTYKIKMPSETGSCNVYVTVAGNGKPLEVFVNGPLIASDIHFAARLASHALRFGVPPEEIIENGWAVKGPSGIWNEGCHRPVTNAANAVAWALQQYIGAQEVEQPAEPVVQENQGCPVCGGRMIYEEGCRRCEICSWSKCG